MFTDWIVVRRMAAELDENARSKRIEAAGRLADGRFGLRVGGAIVAFAPFAPTPLIVIEPLQTLGPEPGWVRAASDALAGLRIDSVRARSGDRVVAFDCSARSRFGVNSGYRLVAELVPRFGNLVLLRDDVVVAAAKEFPRTTSGKRVTSIGEPYEPPPKPAVAYYDGGSEASLATIARAARDGTPEDAARELRRALPQLPQLIALSIVVESLALSSATVECSEKNDGHVFAERCLERGKATLAAAAAGAYDRTEVFVYRRSAQPLGWSAGSIDGAPTLPPVTGGITRLLQVHVVPLAQYAACLELRVPALLPLLRDGVANQSAEQGRAACDARRSSLHTRLAKRRLALRAMRETLERERDDAAQRDDLRIAGELLYAHAGDVPPGATAFVPPTDPYRVIELNPELDAKANAAAIFKRYRKAHGRFEHAVRRLTELTEQERALDELSWELERTHAEGLDEIAEALARWAHREPENPARCERENSARRAPRRSVTRRAAPLEIRIGDDASIYAGRSPRGNAELTFGIAKPNDLWFHARGMPGAHVVLHLDSPRAATDAELRRAAALAAYHSKARDAEKVDVDYTERKFVRRQKDAPPGLVWYTNARTLVVAPRDAALAGTASVDGASVHDPERAPSR